MTKMTNLRLQKKMASKILKAGKNRVKISSDKKASEEIKQAITRGDVKKLIVKGLITVKPKVGSSRGRHRKVKEQQKKGRRSGPGRRKGKATARTPKKRVWIIKVRAQRGLLKSLKKSGKLSNQAFRRLYSLVKGGFFRSKSHLKTYLLDHDLIVKK